MLQRLCWSASVNADDGDDVDHLNEAASHVGTGPVRVGQHSLQRRAVEKYKWEMCKIIVFPLKTGLKA